MSAQDDINRLLSHIARGDLGAVIGDAGRIVQGVTGVSIGGQLGQIGMPAIGGMLNPGQMPPAPSAPRNHPDPCSGQTVPPPPAMPDARGSACCDRYRLTDGFLVDGATGTVWKYQTRSNSFEEIPIRRDKNKQAVVDSLLEAKLAAIRGQYEAELIGITNAKERQKQVAAFEKQQLTPLRLAARALTS